MARQMPDYDQLDPSAPGVPRWVKVFGIVAAVVVVLVVVMLVGGHGPGRHG